MSDTPAKNTRMKRKGGKQNNVEGVGAQDISQVENCTMHKTGKKRKQLRFEENAVKEKPTKKKRKRLASKRGSAVIVTDDVGQTEKPGLDKGDCTILDAKEATPTHDSNQETPQVETCDPSEENTSGEVAASEKIENSDTKGDKQLKFHEMGLDDRLLKAISLLKWSEPTLVQEKAIPLALNGKDILSRARTGSGKTGAYAIPIIQSLLVSKRDSEFQHTSTLVLVPSRELSAQVTDMFMVLLSCCASAISCVNLSKSDTEVISSVMHQKPDIVIGTPGRIQSHIKAKLLEVSSIEWLVIDEADLVLSFGYESDIKMIVPALPNSYQTFVTSATFSGDIESLKNLVLKNPVTLQLREPVLPSSEKLTQYHVICDTEDDKYLLLCALLKLRLIQGKSIIFVNSITRCYRVKLFLEQFSIFCCILNSELPVKSRYHTVEQFNKGLYDYIIAADETQLLSSDATDAPRSRKKKGQGRSKEFGVSRGVDFQKVSNVINFDFPKSVNAYVHRVGRTARGFASGAALSFVTGDEINSLKEAQEKLAENSMHPYQFAMNEIEGFRYRCRDAVRLVTKQAIKDARLRELKTEMLNSAKLQAYFEQNPRDLQTLRHNTALRPSKVKPHMKHVPEYLIPDALKGIAGQGRRKRRKPNREGGTSSRLNPKYKQRREDPLQNFKYAKKDSA